MRGPWVRRSLVLVVLLLAAAGLLPALRGYWWFRESSPIRRGAATAGRVGCLACHGPHGTAGLPDPNTGQRVPAWDGGVPMMYVSGPDEVREYILDGVSSRRAASASASAQRRRAAIRMPAYRDVLDPGEVEDLVAYFMAASRLEPIADPLASRGRDLVLEHGCESCHGIAGAGGVRNPGSYKGYVPGWLGPDFGKLVRDDAEMREWILEGNARRLLEDRLARFFLSRQRLQMPAYGEALSASDTDAVIAYIRWLRRGRD
ncbi:MAG: c-type cytochrome [Acidobacteriota bacterium]